MSIKKNKVSIYKDWKKSGLSAGRYYQRMKGGGGKLSFLEKIRNIKNHARR